jgi:hypothetical protein
MATPATGFFKSLPDTLEGIVSECDVQLARIEEQRSALLRDRRRAAEVLAVVRIAEQTPEHIRLMDSTAADEADAA